MGTTCLCHLERVVYVIYRWQRHASRVLPTCLNGLSSHWADKLLSSRSPATTFREAFGYRQRPQPINASTPQAFTIIKTTWTTMDLVISLAMAQRHPSEQSRSSGELVGMI